MGRIDELRKKFGENSLINKMSLIPDDVLPPAPRKKPSTFSTDNVHDYVQNYKNINLIDFFISFGFNHLDPLKFEELILTIFKTFGFKGNLTPQTGDDGIDVVLWDLIDVKGIIQCKRYDEQQNISPREVREFLGSIIHAKAEYGYFVTTTSFSEQAMEFCKEKGISLVDGIKLRQLFLLAISVEINKICCPNIHIKDPRNFISDFLHI